MKLNGQPSTVIPVPVVTLTFDLLTRKPNKYVFRPSYICDLILVKLAIVDMKILHSRGFLGHNLL